jgi:hypothetical protein
MLNANVYGGRMQLFVVFVKPAQRVAQKVHWDYAKREKSRVVSTLNIPRCSLALVYYFASQTIDSCSRLASISWEKKRKKKKAEKHERASG